MALRPGTVRRASESGPLDRLRTTSVPVVLTASATSSGISERAVVSAVTMLPEVAAARRWAAGDIARQALVRQAVAALYSRADRASAEALDAPPY